MSTWWVREEDLKDEQKAVINLPIGPHLLLQGPPGSGKTNLLVLRANFVHLAGHPNLTVVVFQRALRRFLKLGGAQYDFPLGKLRTNVQWQRWILKSTGVNVPDYQALSFSEHRQRLNDTIRDELMAKGKAAKMHDTLLVDEAHDYTPEEIDIFLYFSKSLFFTADTRQRIYSVSDGMPRIREIVEDKVTTLKYHYRMGPKICRLADELAKQLGEDDTMLATCNYNDAENPSSVDVSRASSLRESVALTLSRLDNQLKAFPNELIGVITPLRKTALDIWDMIAKSDYADQAVLQLGDDNDDAGSDARIYVSTVHSAKGLEFRTVHLLAAEEFERMRLNRNLAFTAVTRAKTTLSIYHSAELPGFLEAALADCEPGKPVPRLADMFGSRKRG